MSILSWYNIFLECSDADPKGSDCYEKFSVMQECMSHYPELYGKDDDDELAAAMDSAGGGGAADDGLGHARADHADHAARAAHAAPSGDN